MELHTTKNSLSAGVRAQAVQVLNARLADCIDLQTQVKQAHWNVKGPDFIALHKLFDEINEDVEEYVDTIAERAVQLGGTVAGTARSVALASSLEEYPLEISAGLDHAAALSDALETFGTLAREAVDAMDELGDAATADIFTEVTRGIDKWLWMVEAHLEQRLSIAPAARMRPADGRAAKPGHRSAHVPK